MGSVRWRKVLRDFGAYRVRTAAVVASIAVGIIAIGTPAGANALLAGGFAQAAAVGRPAASTVSTATGFNAELVEAIRRMYGVEDAEARQSVSAWLVPGGRTATGAGMPSGTGAGAPPGATDIQLVALQDAANQQIDRVLPRNGRFPPGRGEIVLERSAQRLVDVAEGQTVVIRTASGEEHLLRVAGLAYEPGASRPSTSAASRATSPRRRSSIWAGRTRSTSCGSGRRQPSRTSRRSNGSRTRSASGSRRPAPR